MNKQKIHIASAALLVIVPWILFIVRTYTADDVIYATIAYYCCFFAYCVIYFTANFSNSSSHFFSINQIIFIAILMRIGLVVQPIALSDDIYRYLWDGKVSTQCINPYIYSPNADELAYLRTTDLPSKVSVPNHKTVYPPLAQVFFRLYWMSFQDSIVGMKFVLTCLEGIFLWGIIQLLELRKHDIRLVFAVALHPLTAFVTALDGHIEILAILFFVWMLVALYKQHYILSGVLLGFSSLVKPQPLLILPFLLYYTGKELVNFGIIQKVRVLISTLVVWILGYSLYYEPTWSMFETLRLMSKRWYFNSPLFDTLHRNFSNEVSHMILGICFFIVLFIVIVISKTIPSFIHRLWLSVSLLSPMIHPWYILWNTLSLPFQRRSSIILMSGTIFITSYTVFFWQNNEGWSMPYWLVWCQWIPVYCAVYYDYLQRPTPIKESEQTKD